MKKVNLGIALGLVSVVTGANASTVTLTEPSTPAVQLSNESIRPLIESKSGVLLAQGGNGGNAGGTSGPSGKGGNGGSVGGTSGPSGNAGGKSAPGGNGQPKK